MQQLGGIIFCTSSLLHHHHTTSTHTSAQVRASRQVSFASNSKIERISASFSAPLSPIGSAPHSRERGASVATKNIFAAGWLTAAYSRVGDQEVEQFLSSSLLGGYRHALVSLKEALCRHGGTVARRVSLLESCDGDRPKCFSCLCQDVFNCRQNRFRGFLCVVVHRRLLRLNQRCCRCSFGCSSLLEHAGTFRCPFRLCVSTTQRLDISC